MLTTRHRPANDTHSVSYWVEAERYWQFAGEGSSSWCHKRAFDLKEATPGLKVRVAPIRRPLAGDK